MAASQSRHGEGAKTVGSYNNVGVYGGIKSQTRSPKGALAGEYYDPDIYCRTVPSMFEYVRGKIGFDMHLLHDVHERIAPIDAVRLAKALEPYRLFFFEDPLAPGGSGVVQGDPRSTQRCRSPWASCSPTRWNGSR